MKEEKRDIPLLKMFDSPIRGGGVHYFIEEGKEPQVVEAQSPFEAMRIKGIHDRVDLEEEVERLTWSKSGERRKLLNEIDKLKRERDLWRKVANLFYDASNDQIKAEEAEKLINDNDMKK